LTAAALEQRFAFLAAIAAKELVQQIHHGPQVTPFFHIHLEEVPKIVLAGAGETEVTLLLHRCGLCIALRNDDAAQVRAVFARHILPGVFTEVIAKMDLAVLLGGIEEDAPAVIGHLHMTKLRPALRVDAHRSAQIYIEILAALGAHIVPPRQVIGLPLFERALQCAVFGEVDVVGDLFAVVDRRHVAVLRL